MAALRRIGLTILSATVILFAVAQVQTQVETPLVGAIRWDAWQEGGTVNAAVEVPPLPTRPTSSSSPFSMTTTTEAPAAPSTLKSWTGYVIGAGDFSVPSRKNSWQTYTVTGRSPHAPGGILTIKFTGTSGMPWLDNVSFSPR
jgi:hypothetical protein